MRSCEQTQNWTVLQHGESVYEMLEALIAHIAEGHPIDGWRLPSWLTSHGQQIIQNCHSPRVRHYYTVYHDCGKPVCQQVDTDGKSHFPDHARVSKETFQTAIQSNEDSDLCEAADLIGWDMILHTASADEIDQYCREVWRKEDACTLLLAALAEVHSNARLFGGIESISFKTKWKNLDRRGKQLIRFYFGT